MKYIIAITCLILSACSKQQEKPLLYQVQPKEFSISVPAKGELFAAKATVISAPISRNGMQIIAWLAPEFSVVKKGDVIAKFDGEAMEVESRRKQNERAISQQNIIEKNGGLTNELSAINKDIDLVQQEKSFAEKYSIDDVSIQSKLDILDSLQNSEYLGSKQEYLQWKNQSFSESSQGDLGLLQMKLQQHENKLKQLSSSLAQLEVKAPHDGLLAYYKNWRGEKAREGQTMWPGQKIAELPDISDMKAKLFVLENEAIGIQQGQSVEFSLNAYSDQSFIGSVESIAPFPKSIKRGDPQKYFEVIVSLAKQSTEYFVPGRKLAAVITIAEPKTKLVVPLQTVFADKNKRFVYLFTNGEFTAKEVELGQASLSHVEILSGLAQGQQVSLIEQGNRT